MGRGGYNDVPNPLSAFLIISLHQRTMCGCLPLVLLPPSTAIAEQGTGRGGVKYALHGEAMSLFAQKWGQNPCLSIFWRWGKKEVWGSPISIECVRTGILLPRTRSCNCWGGMRDMHLSIDVGAHSFFSLSLSFLFSFSALSFSRFFFSPPTAAV